MADTITTTGIVGTIPTLTDPGPNYASLITNFLNLNVAPHTHDGVLSGNLIRLDQQLLGGDLSLDGYNLTNIRSLQLLNNPSALTGSQDVNCVYVNQNNLGFNNSNGIFVPITNGNTLAITALSFTNFASRSVSSNFTILNTDTYNLVEIDSSGGAITGTLPIAAVITPNPINRFYIFRDVTGHAGTHNITIQVSVGSGNTFADSGATTFVLNQAFGYVALYTDGVSKWFSWSQNTYSDQIVSFESLATLNMNNSFLLTTGGNLETTNTSILFTGSSQIITSGTTAFLNQLVNMDGTTTVEWFTGSQAIFDAGTTLTVDGVLQGSTTSGNLILNSTLTLATGSLLTVNGTLSGSTTGGTLSIGGTLNPHGTTTITGSLNISATTAISNNTTTIANGNISADSATSIVNAGFTTVHALSGQIVRLAFGSLTAGTYTCDTGTARDYYVGLLLTNTTQTWHINLPAAPQAGRIIYVGDVSGLDETTPPTYTVNISGNGNNIINPNPAGGLVTNFNVASSGTNLRGGWNYCFIFDGVNWIVRNQELL